MNSLFGRDKLLLAVCSVLLLCLSRGAAQESSGGGPPPPTPPFVKPPPNHATWTMTVSGSDGSRLPLPPPPPSGKSANSEAFFSLEIRRQQVTQTGKIRQEINTWSDGTTTEDWAIGGISLEQHPISHSIFVIDPAHMEKIPSFFVHKDFHAIPWLSLDTYVRTEEYQGHSCYHFQKKGALAEQAWIDVATKQTIAYSDGKELYSYVYGPVPTSELVLPPEYAKTWQNYQDMNNPLVLHLPSTK